jgi:hypothetical protein
MDKIKKSISGRMFSAHESGPSGNRTRVPGSEAQEDILYPMDPSLSLVS